MLPCARLHAAGNSRAVSVIILLLAVAGSMSAVAGPGPANDLVLALGTVTETSTTDFGAGSATGVAISEIDFDAASAARAPEIDGPSEVGPTYPLDLVKPTALGLDALVATVLPRTDAVWCHARPSQQWIV